MGTLLGTDGNDVLTVGDGNDTVDAGSGDDDLLIVDYSALPGNFIEFGGSESAKGNETISNNLSTSVEIHNVERFSITTSAGHDFIVTGDGNDTVSTGEGDDTIDSQAGVDSINGGLGTDTWIANLTAFHGAFHYDASNPAMQNIGNGVHVAGIEALQVVGGPGNDTFLTYNNGHSDSLYGFQGDDTLQVGGGPDTVDGGGLDTVDGGDQNDLLIIGYAGLPGNFIWNGGTLSNGEGTSVAIFNIERYDVTLSSGNDVMVTGPGDDTVIGGAGNDDIDTGEGAAIVNGGSGIDIWHANLSRFAGPFTYDAASPTTQNVGNGSQVTGIEVLDIASGSGNDRLLTYNNGRNDTIFAGGGDDTVRVGGGADSVDGGDGSHDVLIVDYSAMTGTFTTSGPVVANGKGTSVTFHNFEAYSFSLGFGNDTISTDNGNDTLNGGLGADSLIGGNGNDTYVVDNAADRVVETAGGGTDTIFATVGFTLLAGQSVEVLGTSSVAGTTTITFIGNELAQTLNGNNGINTLYGGGADDTLNGFGGADRLYGGAGHDVIDGGAGADTVGFFGVSDSTGVTRDLVATTNLAGVDKFQFTVKPLGIDAMITHGGLNAVHFDQNLAFDVGSAQLAARHAVLFDPDAGDLNQQGHLYLVVDANGVAGYQAGQDYVVELQGATGTLTTDDFI